MREHTVLDKFYKTNFLYDASFVGEQVNNTLKSLPNDLIRAPYVWTVYNPVESVGVEAPGIVTSFNAKYGFLYPARSVPDFDAALSVGVTGSITDNWWRCHDEPDPPTSPYCAKNVFSGPSDATHDVQWRFPIFATKAKLDGAGQKPGDAAKDYLNCDLWNVCIFIRIAVPKGDKDLTLNWHYKPAHYLLKKDKTAPTGHEANIKHYDVVFGTEQRGTEKTTSPKIATIKPVSADRVWIRELDGDPVIAYREGVKGDLHPCSRRGLCDHDTGKCECFFGYMGHSCHTRTPSEKQGL